MSDAPLGHFDEMDDLVAASIRRDISPEQRSRLYELAAVDIEACDHYLNLVFEASILLTWAKGGDAGSCDLEVEVGDCANEKQQNMASPLMTRPAFMQDPLRLQDAIIQTPALISAPCQSAFTYLSSGWPVAYLVATVVLGIGALIGSVIYVSHPIQIAQQNDSLPSPLSPLPSVVGWITDTTECKWNGIAAKSRAVALGHKFDLASGLLEFTYNTGARVILQGPCSYTVDSPVGGYLALGKITARVEKRGGGRGAGDGKVASDRKVASGQWLVASDHQSSAIRHSPSTISNPQSPIPNPSSSPVPRPALLFTIKTPTATVADLGTEFGVEVNKNGETVSQVFRGSVEVREASVIGESAGRALVLRENEAVHVGRNSGDGHASTITRITVEPSRFTCALPESKSQERLASDVYAEYVLSLKPAVYYRMESPQKPDDPWTLADFSGGEHHGTLHCDKAFFQPPYLNGRYGKSLLFRGPVVMDHAIVPDYPKTTDGRLTVSAWVKVTSGPVRWAMIASNWGDDKYTGQFHFGMYRFDGDLAANVTQRDGRTILVREGESYPLPRGVWQHVAFVADGSTLRLYRNGVEVASAPCSGIEPQTPVAALGIGGKTNDAGTDVAVDTPAYWSGRIDELAIFNRALSSNEIQILYKGPEAKGSQP